MHSSRLARGVAFLLSLVILLLAWLPTVAEVQAKVLPDNASLSPIPSEVEQDAFPALIQVGTYAVNIRTETNYKTETKYKTDTDHQTDQIETEKHYQQQQISNSENETTPTLYGKILILFGLDEDDLKAVR